MSSIVSDIKDMLEAQNVGTFGGPTSSGGWRICIGSEPDEPNSVITLYDTPGDAPNPKFLLDYPRFLVRTRAKQYEQAYAKAEEIKSVLLGLPSQTIGGIRYVGIWVVTDTHFLKADQKGRSIFVNTWRVIREPNTGMHRIPL